MSLRFLNGAVNLAPQANQASLCPSLKAQTRLVASQIAAKDLAASTTVMFDLFGIILEQDVQPVVSGRKQSVIQNDIELLKHVIITSLLLKKIYRIVRRLAINLEL